MPDYIPIENLKKHTEQERRAEKIRELKSSVQSGTQKIASMARGVSAIAIGAGQKLASSTAGIRERSKNINPDPLGLRHFQPPKPAPMFKKKNKFDF